MKKRTRLHYVMSPGSLSGVMFVTGYEVDDPNRRADDYLLEDDDEPGEGRQRSQRNWTQAFKHLPKVWNRLVHQPLWRQPAKPNVSV